MTRAKVPDDKRQRTAQACDSCKRRKQKCDGLKQCTTCVKRNLICYYPNNDNGLNEAGGSPTKRRAVDTSSTSPQEQTQSVPASLKTDEVATLSKDQKSCILEDSPGVSLTKIEPGVPSSSSLQNFRHKREVSDQALEASSRNSTISGPDEEACLFAITRLLHDSTGRLLYVGDSANLSCLHLFRLCVENTTGASPFTTDPRQRNIVENVVSLPSDIKPPAPLPPRHTAEILVESFFTNTVGLIDIFDENAFKNAVDVCYSDPLSAEQSFISLLHLVFAIGLVLATPASGTPESVVIAELRSKRYDMAELFFRSGRDIGDLSSTLLDADFRAVQGLVLITVYMLATSKRNAAYAYHGIAVRQSFALGLHREEARGLYVSTPQYASICSLWRTIFILDQFLAASLGRPPAISLDDCPESALKDPVGNNLTDTDLHKIGINASVNSCLIMSTVLRKFYATRKVSAKTAQEIAKTCIQWSKELHHGLHWRQASKKRIPPARGMTILHVNLFYCHSVILVTRPFFLLLFIKQQATSGSFEPPKSVRVEQFAETCISASYHTVLMVSTAYEAGYLPQRNPFVLYFLFAASLVILGNEFSSLIHKADYSTTISKAIEIMSSWSSADPQAERLRWILVAFRDVVARQASKPNRTFQIMGRTATSAMGSSDPVMNFFTNCGILRNHSITSLKPPAEFNGVRHHSLDSLTVHPRETSEPGPLSAPPSVAGGAGVAPGMAGHYVTAAAEHDANETLSTEGSFDIQNLWDWADPSSAQNMVPTTSAAMSMGIPGTNGDSQRLDGFHGYNGFPAAHPVASNTFYDGMHPSAPLYHTADMD